MGQTRTKLCREPARFVDHREIGRAVTLVPGKNCQLSDFIRPALRPRYGDSNPIFNPGRTIGPNISLYKRNEQFFRRFIASDELRLSSTRHSESNTVRAFGEIGRKEQVVYG